MMSSWRTIRALAPVERRLVIEALMLTIALRVGLRLLPFMTARSYLDRVAGRRGRHASGGRTVHADRIIWAVRAVSSRIPATTCLIEALAAETLLRSYGHAASLKIGVRRGTRLSLDAHAWVECDGMPVVGTTPALAEYVVLS